MKSSSVWRFTTAEYWPISEQSWETYLTSYLRYCPEQTIMIGQVGRWLRSFTKETIKYITKISDYLVRQLVKSDFFYKKLYKPGINYVTRSLVPQFPSRVKEDDWKYLVVLDACRYDAFNQVNEISGNLRKENSSSAWTKEWAIRNFSGGDWSDTVYISASPWVGSAELWMGENPFHSVEEVWNVETQDDGVQRTAGVHPKTVRQAAMKAIKDHPEKRMIIHFQQPHNPLIGDKSIPRDSFDSEGTVFDALRRGEFSREEVWAAYISNLELVLHEVEELLTIMDGKVAITADHGECFGEFNLFEHPGSLVPPLLEVPWLEVKKSRDIDLSDIEVEYTEQKSEGSNELENKRKEQLEQLGYLD